MFGGENKIFEKIYIFVYYFMDNLNVFNFFYYINDDFNKDIILK